METTEQRETEVTNNNAEDAAVITGLLCIFNCSKYRKKFEKTSIDNFKAKYAEATEVLGTLFDGFADPIQFTSLLSNYAKDADNEVKSTAVQAFKKSVENGVPISESIYTDWGIEKLWERR